VGQFGVNINSFCTFVFDVEDGGAGGSTSKGLPVGQSTTRISSLVDLKQPVASIWMLPLPWGDAQPLGNLNGCGQTSFTSES